MLQHPIIHFRSIICQVVAYGRLKRKENFTPKTPYQENGLNIDDNGLWSQYERTIRSQYEREV